MAFVRHVDHEFDNAIEQVDVRLVNPVQNNVKVFPVHHVDGFD